MLNQIIFFITNNTPLFYWTQSLWRDEAFSVWLAEKSVPDIITYTAGDFNPPLYYILLKFWLMIFGNSEIVLRGFSAVTFLIFLIVLYKFAEKFFQSAEAARTTTILAGLSPMLLYHAFELRMYALLLLWTALSMYFFYTKHWIGHMITTALGLYTQPYMLFVLIIQNTYLLLQRDFKRVAIQTLGVFVLFLPWVPFLITQLKNSGPMWMYPVTSELVFAVLGNLFMGYEGTPGGLWSYMSVLSGVFLLLLAVLWRQKQSRKNLMFIAIWILLPVVLILGVSLVKPVYVHRYLIYVSVGLIMLISAFIVSIKNAKARQYTTWVIIGLVFLANFLAVSFHRKIPIRNAFEQLTPLVRPGDVIYAESPLVYYETLYYAPPHTPVFLYNPESITPPRFVAGIGMPESVWAVNYPVYPQRAFLVGEEGTYKIVSTIVN